MYLPGDTIYVSYSLSRPYTPESAEILPKIYESDDSFCLSDSNDFSDCSASLESEAEEFSSSDTGSTCTCSTCESAEESFESLCSSESAEYKLPNELVEDILEGSLVQRKFRVSPMDIFGHPPQPVANRVLPQIELGLSWFATAQQFIENRNELPATPLSRRVSLKHYPRSCSISRWNRKVNDLLMVFRSVTCNGRPIDYSRPALILQDHPLGVVLVCQNHEMNPYSRSRAKSGKRNDACVLYLQNSQERNLSWSSLAISIITRLLDICFEDLPDEAAYKVSRTEFRGNTAHVEAEGVHAEFLMDRVYERLNYFYLPNDLHIRVKYGNIRYRRY